MQPERGLPGFAGSFPFSSDWSCQLIFRECYIAGASHSTPSSNRSRQGSLCLGWLQIKSWQPTEIITHKRQIPWSRCLTCCIHVVHTKGNVNPPHLIHTSRKRPPIPSLFRLNTPTSAFPNSRPRGCVAGPRWRIRPDQARVIRLVRPRKRNQRPGRPVPAPSHSNLRTADVKLSTTRVLREMQRDTLHPNQIIAARQILRNREADLRFICQPPKQHTTRQPLFRSTHTKQGRLRRREVKTNIR